MNVDFIRKKVEEIRDRIIISLKNIKKSGIQNFLKKFSTTFLGYVRSIFKKDFVVGLDVGATSVKMAQFIKKEDGLYLIKVDLEEFDFVEDERLRQENILSALGKSLRGVDIKKSKFIAVINCPKTAVKRIQAPYIPKSELRDGIFLEAKSHFPFPLTDALMDFEITDAIVDQGIKRYVLLLATSQKSTVYRHLSLLKRCGIRPASLVPVPVALNRLVEKGTLEKEKVRACLEIGGEFSEIAIFKAKALVFSRKIPIAGGSFTKAMTDVLASEKGKIKLSAEEAEKIKRKVGIPSEKEPKMIDDKVSTIHILSLLRAPLDQLKNEIERCLDYYREESGSGKIDELILFGGGASLKGLDKFLSENLEIEVKIGDPFENVKIEAEALQKKEELAHRLSMAVGAALSEARGVNLLPVEIKEEIKRTVKRTTAEVIVTSVILITLFIYIGMKIQLSNYQKRISVARMELFSLGPQLKELKLQGLVKKILYDEPYWEDVFKELSNVIPGDMYLTEVAMREKNIILQGVVLSDEPENSLANFILTLEKGIFKDVKLVTTKELREKAANEFKIRCWID